MKKIINISSLIGGLIACTTLQAAIINYGFGDGTTGTLTPTSNNTNINTSDFGVGAGLINATYAVDTGNAFGYVADPLTSATSFGGASADFGHSSATLANSVDNGDYLTFSISTTGAAYMNLTSLTFQYKANDTNNAADGLAVYSSVNTDFSIFSSTDTSGNIAATYGAGVDTNADNAITEDIFHLITVDLSDPEYQGLDEIEFRIYLFGVTNINSNSSASIIDDVTLNGLVVVPEPSSLTLLLLASSSCLFIRSRKSSSKKAA